MDTITDNKRCDIKCFRCKYWGGIETLKLPGSDIKTVGIYGKCNHTTVGGVRRIDTFRQSCSEFQSKDGQSG